MKITHLKYHAQNADPENFIVLYENLPARKADLYILILSSQDIETKIIKHDKTFDLLVKPSEIQTAISAVSTYHDENKFWGLQKKIQQVPPSVFHSPACYFIMALMAAVHAGAVFWGSHEELVLHYGASALYILQGQTYRAVTALFLHTDIQHLAGNLAGLLLFAGPVIRISGYGSGPFILLFSGTMGNLINAHFYQSAHLSIGASTAVMGAAGLLAVFQFMEKAGGSRLRALVPVCAGAVLMAMFSQGERTDVWAHVFGFASGFVCGLFFFPLNQTLDFKYKNAIALGLTMAILSASFLTPFTGQP